MKTLEECVSNALDCNDSRLLPFLPYILQDFWGMGSNPEVMIDMARKHHADTPALTVLDLGCGKGVVSVQMAKELGCQCHGIDAIAEFIAVAEQKAAEYGVANLCRFEVGDIRERVSSLGKYDVIILGSIGQVFGNYRETLTLLDQNLNDGGIILIDDGYVDDGSSYKHEQISGKSELLKQIAEAGMQLADEVIGSDDVSLPETYDAEYHNLLKRCRDLAALHPDMADLFIGYANHQKSEYDILKTDIICSTLVVKKGGKIR